MTGYEAVNAVWSDLEGSFKKQGNGKSRLDFVKLMAAYGSDEAKFRSITKRINEDHEGATNEEVEVLLRKLDVARANIQYCDRCGIQPKTLDTFATVRMGKSYADFYIIPKCQKVSLDEVLREGSVLPRDKFDNYKVAKRVVEDYHLVCMDNNALKQLLLSATPEAQGGLIFQSIVGFVRAGKLRAPMIAASADIIEKMKRKKGITVTLAGKNVKEGEGTALLYDVQDKYGEAKVLCLQI